MAQPGDRIETKCKGCKARMLKIFSTNGKWIPCEPVPARVDGNKMLVFANGVVGRQYGDYEGGHESHWAYCPAAKQFRKKEQDKAAKVKQKKAVADGEPITGCGCLGGEI